MGLNRGRGDQVQAHKLYRKNVGYQTLVPPKFRRQLKTTIFTEEVQSDYKFPDDSITNGRIFTELKQQQEDYSRSTLTTIDELLLTTGSLTSYKRTKDAQIETVTESLVDEATPPITLNALIVEYDQEALGDGKSIKTVGTIPDVFPATEYKRQRPIVTPEEFRARLEQATLGITSAGQATDPTPLSTGEYEAIDTQLDEFTHRLTTSTLGQNLPVTILGTRTNKYKQVEYVRRTLEDEATTPALPTAIRDVEFKPLGDGTAVEEWDYTLDLFLESTYSRQRPLVTPEDFRAQLQTTEHSELVEGTASPPSALPAGQIEVEQQQINEFVYRNRERAIDTTLPTTIANLKTNRFKQVLHVDRVLELDVATPQTPTSIKDVTFTKLGDGTALEEREYTDALFLEEKFTVSRGGLRVIPEDFRAKIEIVDTSLLIEGTAAPPALSPGDGILEATEEQVNDFVYRGSTSAYDPLALPIQIVNSQTNRYKQVETITRIWEPESTTPAVPTALRNVEFKRLGDGTAIEERIDVPEVFEGLSSSTEIIDVLPEPFKASLPLHVREFTDAAIVADPPGLNPGDLERVETQLDNFTRRVRTRGRAEITYPQTKTVRRRIGAHEYGGEVLRLDGYFNTSEPAVETGFDITNSEVSILGDGTYFRQTERLDVASAWPTLTEYDQDPETLALITTTYQVVDNATVTAPSIVTGQITRYKRIDQWRSLKIVEIYSLPADYDEQRFMAHSFPSLWDWTTYVYNTACGAVGPIRHGFASMVEARLAISFTTTKQTITGLTLIPNTHHLVHDIVAGVLNDAGVINYVGDCTGPVSLPASSPTYTTYNSTIRGTEQLISGESVLWKAGLYKNSRLYVTML